MQVLCSLHCAVLNVLKLQIADAAPFTAWSDIPCTVSEQLSRMYHSANARRSAEASATGVHRCQACRQTLRAHARLAALGCQTSGRAARRTKHKSCLCFARKGSRPCACTCLLVWASLLVVAQFARARRAAVAQCVLPQAPCYVQLIRRPVLAALPCTCVQAPAFVMAAGVELLRVLPVPLPHNTQARGDTHGYARNSGHKLPAH
jgi:hypothetical protein